MKDEIRMSKKFMKFSLVSTDSRNLFSISSLAIEALVSVLWFIRLFAAIKVKWVKSWDEKQKVIHCYLYLLGKNSSFIVNLPERLNMFFHDQSQAKVSQLSITMSQLHLRHLVASFAGPLRLLLWQWSDNHWIQCIENSEGGKVISVTWIICRKLSSCHLLDHLSI